MAAVTLTTIAIGAAIGAGVGAVATYASGGRGDALWKGALVGAVGGAVTGGVGSWATGALGATAGGALAGGAGGIVSGALGTALNGGNGSDYLKNMAFGGLGGAALGGLGGYASGAEAGAEAGVNPVTGEAVSTGTPTTTPLPEGDIATGINQAGSGAGAVEGTISGPTAPATQGTTTPLSDTVSNLSGNQYAAAPTGTMTDIGGSSAVPQELPGGVPISSSTSPSTLESLSQQGQAQSTNSMKNLGLDGVNMAEGQTPFPSSTPAPEQSTGGDWWKGYTKGLGSTTTPPKGTGKGMNDLFDAYLKQQMAGGVMRGLGGLVGAGEAQQNRNQLMDLYNQQNQQNQFYANQLQQTYQNPQGYLGSPEAQATRSAALQKALAANAAAGRRTQGGALNNLLMQEQLKNLAAYRQGMPRPQYGTASQVAQAAQQQSPLSSITGGLANIFTPAAAAYLYS